MDPITGLLLYVAACVVIGIIANKRGRSWWRFVGSTVLASAFLVFIFLLDHDIGFVPFGVIAPLPIAFVLAIALPSGAQLASRVGSYGEYKRCPFCAESVRREAIKCRHCGADIPVTSAPQQ